jgi:hypothetical protein
MFWYIGLFILEKKAASSNIRARTMLELNLLWSRHKWHVSCTWVSSEIFPNIYKLHKSCSWVFQLRMGCKWITIQISYTMGYPWVATHIFPFVHGSNLYMVTSFEWELCQFSFNWAIAAPFILSSFSLWKWESSPKKEILRLASRRAHGNTLNLHRKPYVHVYQKYTCIRGPI